MMTVNSNAAYRCPEWTPPPLPLRVLVAYDDFGDGLRAKQCLDDVLNEAGIAARCDASFCRLDLLEEPAVRAKSEREAAEADLVLLSMHGDRAMPPPVKDCMRSWLGQRSDDYGALAVLLDAENRRTPAARDTLTFLQWATQRPPMNLFAGFAQACGSATELTVEEIHRHAEAISHVLEDILRQRADTTTQLLEHILHLSQAPPRWGLNE